jgi:ribosomal protein S6--L-glutamate ligase
MDILARLQEAGVVVVNPPRCIEAAVDKFLSSARLAVAGLLTPRTVVCQTAAEARAAFAQLGGDVVVKPLFGGEGRGIFRLQDEELANRAFSTLQQLRAVLYVQEFIPHAGYDIRLFVLGDQVLGMRRINGHDWRTNVSRGAHTEPFAVDDHFRHLALAAAHSVGAVLAGVDVLPAPDGRLFVIEVNAVPGWKALARTLETDIAALVLDDLQTKVRA